MNRENAKELWPIIKAFGDGEDVEYQSCGKGAWVPKDEGCAFNQEPSCYRIKPKPREFWLCWNREDDGNFGDRFAYPTNEFSKGAVNHWDNHIKVSESE